MARKSVASLAIVPRALDKRLPPPEGMTGQEEALWREVVDSKPAEWFDVDNAPLLREYVRASVMCDLLDFKLQTTMGEGAILDAVKMLLDMRDKEARRMTSLATKLRLTQQSQYTPKSAATANKRAAGKRPWQK